MSSRKFKFVSATLLAGVSAFSLSQQAAAQVKRPAPDGNGIDVIAGTPIIPSGHLTIGQPSDGGLDFYRVWQGGGWYHNFQGAVTVDGTHYTVSVGPSVESFTLTGGVYQSDDGSGSTLTKSSVGNWTYTLSDGTVIFFENPGTGSGAVGLIQSITRPNGFVTTITNKYQDFCEIVAGQCDAGLTTASRIQSVTTNTGYHMKLQYAVNYTTTTPKQLSQLDAWQRLTKVTAINGTVDYCDPDANSCTSLTQSWPTATIAVSTGPGFNNYVDTWADALANTTTGTVNGNLTSIQSPADPSVDFSIAYTSGLVSSFTQGGGTWTYNYADVGTTRTTTVTQPLGGSKVYVSDTALRRLDSVTDELGHTTSYQYDAYVRPTRVTQPEGNYTQLTYDGRGNVTEQRDVAKSGSGLADIVSTAIYPSTCTNAKTCNEPTSTTDPRGNTTDYTYDSSHGGVLTATAPAATPGAVRPQIRYGYSSLYAYYKNSSGTIVAAPTPVTKLTSTSACQTLSSCAGTADEVKATVIYGSSGVANNLLPTSSSSGNGNGTLTATTANAYDIFGNLTSVDGPLSGTADTWGFRYDADRRLTMRVSPDPDGTGPLLHRAQKLTYNGDSNVTKVEAGTTPTLTGAFTPVASGERTQYLYDTLGRRTKELRSSGTSTTNAVSDYSYDVKGRLSCTTIRMNPAIFPGPTIGACSAGTQGSYGPDRITQLTYDNADELTQVTEALGTSDQAVERTLVYTPNGFVGSIIDGENNRTDTYHDGFDRLGKIFYPSSIKGAGVSDPNHTDQYAYDANGNIAIFYRSWSNERIYYTYDNLDRLTFQDQPSPEGDKTYRYDLLGRLTYADNVASASTYGYDALGRQVSANVPWGAFTRQYDLAGRLTRLTWWDGFYVDYDRLVTGELSKVRENGATSGVGVLATYGYDNLGNRTSLTYGDGSAATYGYDGISRLNSLAQDLPGTSADLTKTFSYNPASQIVSETVSNDAYAWGQPGTDQTQVTNGLNQVISVNGTATTHDTRSNLTSDPLDSATYSYNSENMPYAAAGTGLPENAALNYDAFNNLIGVDSGSSQRRFVYDDNEAVAETNTSGAIQWRVVRGDQPDEVIVEYWGNTTAARYFDHLDERNSVIAVSDPAANVFVNIYDEYGWPGTNNAGRFGYTGQMWLPEIHLYSYKARMYDHRLGRFMQPDPIGYAGDGPNLYAYVLDDPVNRIDPNGMRSLTRGEIKMLGPLTTIVPRNLSINEGRWLRNGITWDSRTVAFPPALFSLDYSKSSDPNQTRTFWHELFHVIQLHSNESWGDLAWLQVSHWVSGESVDYTYDFNKDFSHNNYEAQAAYFEACMSGADCSELDGYHIDQNLSFAVKSGDLILMYTATGSRIPRAVKLKKK